MTVAKVSEITSTSSKSFEDAIEKGIKRADKTLKNLIERLDRRPGSRDREGQGDGLPRAHAHHLRARGLIRAAAAARRSSHVRSRSWLRLRDPVRSSRRRSAIASPGPTGRSSCSTCGPRGVRRGPCAGRDQYPERRARRASSPSSRTRRAATSWCIAGAASAPRRRSTSWARPASSGSSTCRATTTAGPKSSAPPSMIKWGRSPYFSYRGDAPIFHCSEGRPL